MWDWCIWWVLVSASAAHGKQVIESYIVDWACSLVSCHLCTVPSVPLGVTLQVTTATSLQVSWSTPTFSNGPNLTYHVKYTGVATENAVNGSFFMTFFLESSTTSVTISGLVPFSTYTIGVRASTSVGAGPTAFVNTVTNADARK